MPATARRSMDGRITSWSAGMESRYGFTSAEALGRDASELLRTIFEQSRLQAESELTGVGHWMGNVVNHHGDGRAGPTGRRRDRHDGVDANVAVIYYEHGDPIPGGLAETRLFAAALDRITRDLSEALTAGGA